jgi:hypothetical protein
MRTLNLFVAVTLCLAGHASAQTSNRPAQPPAAQAGSPNADAATVTAFAAILRGDYARASELLSPLVRDWGNIHAPAALFLGMLYEHGLGVSQDPTRACALYARGQGGSGPLGDVAGQLMRAHLDSFGADSGLECRLLANVGINHGFAPAQFSLDTDHWIAIDLNFQKQAVELLVSHQGKEARAQINAPMSLGTIFLPIQYTSLDTGAETRRHFIEIAAWLPEGQSRWRLIWTLTEITQAEATNVASETLTTFEGAMAPTDVAVELRELVTLRMNDSGSAEFEIHDGAEARREGIPTLAERREIAQEAAKRKTANEKVNWKRRLDPARQPSLDYADADGCFDLFVYGWSVGRAEAISVRADRRQLELADAPRTFDLAIPQQDIEVVAEVFDRPLSQPFCTDSGVSGVQREKWQAIAGRLTIQLAPGVRARDPQQYRATIQIDNAEFQGPTGATVKAPRPIRLAAIVSQLDEPDVLTDAR